MRSVYRSVRRVAYPGVELATLEHEEVLSGLEDTALGGDRPGRVYVVAGHHSHGDAGALTLAYRFRHLQQPHSSQLKLHRLQRWSPKGCYQQSWSWATFSKPNTTQNFWTQPNPQKSSPHPTQPNPTQPNPTQPNPSSSLGMAY